MIAGKGTWAEWEVGEPGLVALGRYLHELRTRQRLSIRAMARESGVSPAYQSAIENCTYGSVPSLKIFKRYADHFQIHPEVLLQVAGLMEDPEVEPNTTLRATWHGLVEGEQHRNVTWLSPGALAMLADYIVMVADNPTRPDVLAMVGELRPFTQEKG